MEIKMIIRIRTIFICGLGLALYVNQTCFGGMLSSSLFWALSVFLLLFLVLKRNDLNFSTAGKKDFIYSIAVFLGISAFSIIFNNIYHSENSAWIPSIKIWLSYLVCFLGLTLSCTLVPNRTIKNELSAVSRFFVYISVLPVFLGAFQAFFYEFGIWFPFAQMGELRWNGRYYTLFQNPNGHSQILFIMFCLAQYLKINEISKRKKRRFTFFQILCFINLCMAASRGTLAAIIAAWLVYDWIYFVRYRINNHTTHENGCFILKQGTGLFVCVVVLYFGCNYISNIVPYNLQKMAVNYVQPAIVYAADEKVNGTDDKIVVRDYYEHGEDISNGRFELWTYGIKIFLEHPFLGVGLYGDKFISCHNAYISTLLAYGMIGFCSFAYVLIKALNIISIHYKKFTTKRSIQSYGILASCCVGIMVMALTNDLLMFTFEFPNIFFYYLIGYLMRKPEMEAIGEI